MVFVNLALLVIFTPVTGISESVLDKGEKVSLHWYKVFPEMETFAPAVFCFSSSPGKYAKKRGKGK